MVSNRSTRRGVLRAGCLGVAAGLAGCAGLLESSGDGTRTGTAASATARFPVGEWLPAPATDGNDSSGFILRRPRTIDRYEDPLSGVAHQMLTGSPVTAYTGIGVEELRASVSVPTLTEEVAVGSFDRENVADGLRDADFETVDTYRTYRTFLKSSDDDGIDVVVTLGAGVALAGVYLDTERGLTAHRRTIDAHAGDSPRLTDEYDGMATLLEHVGDGTWAGGETDPVPAASTPRKGRFAGGTASGFDVHIGEDESSLSFAFVFEDAGAARDAPVDRWIDDVTRTDGPFDDAAGFESSVTGRTVLVEATIPTPKLAEQGDVRP